MSMLRTAGIIARVGLTVLGVVVTGLAAAGLSPAGCARARVAQLAGQAGPLTLRASKLWRVINAPTPAVVVPAQRRPGGWEVVKVTRVVDGDTYEVLANTGRAVVRLQGVDAPETSQPFGAQATDSARALVLGKSVLLHSVGADAYGRTLGAVRLRPAAFSAARSRALDSLLVVRGWAWAYAPSGQVVVRAGLQQQAQAAGRGLWKCGTIGVVRPGVWRAYNRQEKALAWVGCPW